MRAVADGRRARYPWLLVLTFSTISVGFNMVHAAPTVAARLVAAIPPAALVLSFELLMRQLRAACRPTIVATPEAAPPTHVVVETPGSSQSTPRRELSVGAPNSPLLERARDIYAAAHRTDERITGLTLARELGISDGYARRPLRQLATEAAQPHNERAQDVGWSRA